MSRSVHVRVPDDGARGVYANIVLVSHSGHEFTVDLCQVCRAPDAGEVVADVVSRVHIPPTLVVPLIQTLQRNLDAYQDQFGAVRAVHGIEQRA